MKRAALVVAFLLAANATSVSAQEARGLAVSLPLVGRLAGAGGIVYKTAVDITNHSTTATQIDFYVDGVDVRTTETIGIFGSLTASGFAGQGNGTIGSRANVHFDDFVDALFRAGLIPASTLNNGFLGSALFVFNNATRSGQGSVTARFYHPATAGPGTVGVALNGHEISANEPQVLTATVHDTRSPTSRSAQVYSNVFINNSGLTVVGTPTSESVDVEIRLYAAWTGVPVGDPVSLTIGPGKTAALTNIMAALRVPASEQSAVVVARVVSGNASIQGLVSVIDNHTKDGSAFAMGRGD